MSACRFLAGCVVAAAVVTSAVLAITAYLNHESGRAHRAVKGIK